MLPALLLFYFIGIHCDPYFSSLLPLHFIGSSFSISLSDIYLPDINISEIIDLRRFFLILLFSATNYLPTYCFSEIPHILIFCFHIITSFKIFSNFFFFLSFLFEPWVVSKRRFPNNSPIYDF
jgi:hypothetical protein